MRELTEAEEQELLRADFKPHRSLALWVSPDGRYLTGSGALKEARQEPTMQALQDEGQPSKENAAAPGKWVSGRVFRTR